MPLLFSVTMADSCGSCRRAATATSLGFACPGQRGFDIYKGRETEKGMRGLRMPGLQAVD